MTQGVEEWSDVEYQDMLMCPRQQSGGDVTSNIGDSNSRAGATRGESHTTHQLSVGRSLDHEGSMRVVWMTRSGVAQVKSRWKS